MTIKQHGGIFGRNPTFNDVEVVDLQATNIDLPDNGRLRIGTGDDLQVYHNGSHSYILDAGTGDLKILGQNVEIGALDGTLSFKAISNSYATLYYNNASRARTTFYGLEITSGNLIVPSGNGIDFSADGQAAGMTSELLDDYEEGTWTPTAGGGVTVIGDFSSSGTYTKVGRMVTVRFVMSGSTSVAVNSGSSFVLGLPFAGASGLWFVGSCLNSSASLSTNPFVLDTAIYSAEAIPAVASIYGTITYMV